jgi:hypothetical protein
MTVLLKAVNQNNGPDLFPENVKTPAMFSF